jgi:hypothetical protein
MSDHQLCRCAPPDSDEEHEDAVDTPSSLSVTPPTKKQKKAPARKKKNTANSQAAVTLTVISQNIAVPPPNGDPVAVPV